jgi:glycosyltransferase involved in cell wall biosynthesis
MRDLLPQITVITPVYNGEKYIAETIDSVISSRQHVNLEYIVINDGSNDRTCEILDRYRSEIVVLDVKNGGEAAAVNIGINLARAPLIMVVSADDPIRDPAIFEESINEHAKNPDLSATYVDWAVIDEFGKTMKHKKTKEFSINELVGFTNCLPGPGAVFSTNKAREISGRSSAFRFVSDYDFWLRLSTKGPFNRIPKELAQWRTHQGSTTVIAGGDQMALERVRVIEDFLVSYECPKELKQLAISHAYYYAARLSLDFKISRPRTLLLKSIQSGRKWPKRANFFVAVSILAYPIPRILLQLQKKITKVLQNLGNRSYVK